MKYCIHCGKEIKETAGFCPYCGKKQAEPVEKKDDGGTEPQSAESDTWKESAKEKISQAKEKGAEFGKAGVNAVQDGVKAVKDSSSKLKNSKKYRKVAVPLVFVCVVLVAVVAIVLSRGGSHSSDEKALKEIIADQKAMGATINEKNGARYEWNEDGRLIGISWNGCSLNGSVSFSKLDCLERLNCENNQLSSLDVGGCKKLKELYCGENQLSKLDVSNCTGLENLSCSYNSLGVLDVGKCVSLTSLGCEDNKLTALDVSNCDKLEELYCDEDVKISGCSAGIIHYDEH